MTSSTIIMVLFLIQGSLGHALPQSPIVGVTGGHTVNIEDAPFMATVLYYIKNDNYTYYQCSGSIIHEQFVLTSASRIKDPFLSVTIRVGSTRYNEGGKLHQIEKRILHESYSDEKLWHLNNVGLLKLSEPVTFGPSVAAIKLADASFNIPVGLTANVTGWGEIYYFWHASRDLHQGSVIVSPQDECNNYYNYNLTDNQVCVHNDHEGACDDDEGGPLVAGDLQIGIVSYGSICTLHYTVYEKVAPHLQWIRNKIRQNL